MPRYEELNETQQRLYDELQAAMKEGENIIDLLTSVSKEEDLLKILTTVKCIEFEDGEEHTLTPLAYAINLKNSLGSQRYITNILSVAKEKSILEEVLTTANIKINLSNGQEYTSTPLVHAIILNKQRGIKAILNVAEKNNMLEKVFASVRKDDLNETKKILERLKNQEQDEKEKTKISGWLKILAKEDPQQIADGLTVLKKVMSDCKSQEQSLVAESRVSQTEGNNIIDESSTSEIENSKQKDKVKTTNKPIIIGCVYGAIAALATGGGCFAAGVALPILALIDIAIAAALVTGLVAGITYAILNPGENLDRANVGQGVVDTGVNITA